MASIFQAQFPTRDIRDVGLGAGDPAAFASLGGSTAGSLAGNIPDPNQTRIFGLAILDLLKQYQGIEKFPLREQGFRGQEEQARRLSFTSPELIGASPAVQARARGAEVSAVEPTITGSRVAGQTFASQLETFRDVLGQARLIQQSAEEAATKAKEDAAKLIDDSFARFGGAAFEDADPNEMAQLEKLAGYPKGYLSRVRQTIKEREVELTQAQRDIQNELAEQRLAVSQQNAYINSLLAGIVSGGLGEGGEPSFITASRGDVAGLSYIDMGKLTPKQVPQAQTYSAATGIPLLSKEDANKLQEAQAAYSSALTLLNKIREQAQGLVTAEDAAQAVKQNIKLTAESFIPSKARTYQKTIKAFSALLTRAAGEKGTLATLDVQRMIDALPTFYETRTTLADKTGNLDSVFQGQFQGAISAYLGTVLGKGLQDSTGTIRVREKSSGRTGTIPVNEFDPKLYDRI